MNAEPGSPSNAASDVPEGWYPDGTGGLRWWDGAQWTQHTHPLEAESTEPAAAQASQAAAANAAAQQEQYQQHAQEQYAAQQDQYAAQQPQRSRKGLIITLVSVGAVLVLGLVVGAGALVAKVLFSAAAPVVSEGEEYWDQPLPGEGEGTPFDDTDLDSLFEEREQFIRDQQLPLDGSPLRASTPEQLQFIEELQRKYEHSGTPWNAHAESLSLALAADACETSILSGHRIDEFSVRTHAATSPLIAQITSDLDEQTRIIATGEMMRDATMGVSYLCPADHEQWSSALDAIGEDW